MLEYSAKSRSFVGPNDGGTHGFPLCAISNYEVSDVVRRTMDTMEDFPEPGDKYQELVEHLKQMARPARTELVALIMLGRCDSRYFYDCMSVAEAQRDDDQVSYVLSKAGCLDRYLEDGLQKIRQLATADQAQGALQHTTIAMSEPLLPA